MAQLVEERTGWKFDKRSLSAASEEIIDETLVRGQVGADLKVFEQLLERGKEKLAWSSRNVPVSQEKSTDEMFRVIEHFGKLTPAETLSTVKTSAFYQSSSWTTSSFCILWTCSFTFVCASMTNMVIT